MFCLAVPALLRAAEENLWPLLTVDRTPGGEVERRNGLGPLLFEERGDDGQASGFRPFYLHRRWPAEDREAVYLCYPLFNWARQGTDRRWSVFSLINFSGWATGAAFPAPARNHGLDIWPFYFSRTTGDPATSYRALLPLHGTLRDRFGSARIDFTLAPLYVRTQTAGVTAVNAPWPFVKIVRGAGQSGFQFWPFYGERERAGVSSEQFVAWPFYFANTREVEGGTDRYRALLPFYATRTAPGLRDESFLFFFGYTQRTDPAYRQIRYFWPLFVQAAGANGRRTDRWAPFYTHSLRSGTDKTWVLWPLFRQEKWHEAGLAQRKTQLLYFLYWDLTQRDPARPTAPAGSKTHLWPLYSAWDNGAGCHQFQLFSPFEVFFQHDEQVRTLWSPLTALYRFDRRSPEAVRASLLFNAVTYRRTGADWQFSCGPLFTTGRTQGRRRFSLLGGLVVREPAPTGSPWRFFWSHSRPATATDVSPSSSR